MTRKQQGGGEGLQAQRCASFHTLCRAEEEGVWALPHGEFGFDVIALVEQLRYAQHRSFPEIYRELRTHRVVIAERTVTNLLERYEELLARSLLSEAEEELVALIQDAQTLIPVPIIGVISDGQIGLRHAVAKALPNIPHQLCQYHYPRESAV